MPPAPSCSRISYAPKRVPGDKVDGTAPGVSGGPMNLIAQLLNSQADCSTLRGHVELILESMPRRVAAPPLDALIIPKPWGIHGYSNTTAPTEGAVSPKSVEFANHPEGTRQPDRRTDHVLCGLGPRDLQGTSPPRRRGSGYWCLLRRFTAGCNSRMRTDHLPNGGRCDGHTYGRHRCYGRG